MANDDPIARGAGTPVRGGAAFAGVAPKVKLGVTKLLEEPEKCLGEARARVGLVANYSAVDEYATPIIRLFSECPGIKLSRIYAAEHGLWGCEQAGVRVGHAVDERTGVDVISLYGETVKPTPEMLEDIDVLVCNDNDVGSRYWTGLSTTALCIEAAAEAGKPIVVADRPNPLGGKIVEGDLQQPLSDLPPWVRRAGPDKPAARAQVPHAVPVAGTRGISSQRRPRRPGAWMRIS